MNLKEAIEYTHSIGIVAEDLDELVIDMKCQEASDINNGGTEDQLKYLVEKLGEEHLKQVLDDLALECNSFQ